MNHCVTAWLITSPPKKTGFFLLCLPSSESLALISHLRICHFINCIEVFQYFRLLGLPMIGPQEKQAVERMRIKKREKKD